ALQEVTFGAHPEECVEAEGDRQDARVVRARHHGDEGEADRGSDQLALSGRDSRICPPGRSAVGRGRYSPVQCRTEEILESVPAWLVVLSVLASDVSPFLRVDCRRGSGQTRWPFRLGPAVLELQRRERPECASAAGAVPLRQQGGWNAKRTLRRH